MLEQTTRRSKEERDLLLFSDVHLGADLKRRVLEAAGSFDALCQRDHVDRALGGLLDHYAQDPPARGPWRLVLAGDIVDFIGINLSPVDLGESAPFEPSAKETEFGLDPLPERGAWQMGLVARRHPRFFERLGAFLADGHELVLVRGNHDAAFHWPQVRQSFLEAVLDGASRAGHRLDARDLAERVRFEDWFYLEPGRIFVEHGHLHDELCAEPDQSLVEPGRPNRLAEPISTQLLRRFANRFPSLDWEAAEKWSMRQALAWAFFVENPLRIALAFLGTIAVVLKPYLWPRKRLPGGASRGEATVTTPEGLSALVRHAARMTLRGVLRLFYLDRAMTMGGGLMLSASCVTLAKPWDVKGTAAAGLVLAAWAVDRWMAAGRDIAIAPKLERAAEDIARACAVPLVVMGHSHVAQDTSLGSVKSRYVNLGAWVGAHRPSPGSAGFVHLIVRGQEAELRRWPAPVARG